MTDFPDQTNNRDPKFNSSVETETQSSIWWESHWLWPDLSLGISLSGILFYLYIAISIFIKRRRLGVAAYLKEKSQDPRAALPILLVFSCLFIFLRIGVAVLNVAVDDLKLLPPHFLESIVTEWIPSILIAAEWMLLAMVLLTWVTIAEDILGNNLRVATRFCVIVLIFDILAAVTVLILLVTYYPVSEAMLTSVNPFSKFFRDLGSYHAVYFGLQFTPTLLHPISVLFIIGSVFHHLNKKRNNPEVEMPLVEETKTTDADECDKPPAVLKKSLYGVAALIISFAIARLELAYFWQFFPNIPAESLLSTILRILQTLTTLVPLLAIEHVAQAAVDFDELD